LPGGLPAAAALAPIEIGDPRLDAAFDDPEFDSVEFGGTLRAGHDWPMDFIYPPNVSHVGSSDFLATVAAAAKLANDSQFDTVSAVLQGKDGVYYLADSLSAGFREDGGGDWELDSGDLATVTVDAPEVVAVVDRQGWFDLRTRD
jgi:hypothetical protein